MGTGITAVAGIENEPLSHRADIEEAQAELRQELTGRNERRKELEFLEKGGDPLDLKFGEPLSGLWPLCSTEPLVNRILSSDGDRREQNLDYIQEDGPDSKRARGLSGKFCYQDAGGTPISVERTPPDTVPAAVRTLIEDDRKGPPKKELDACKSNKVTVKNQYARRNRQRSNPFSNGLAASRELGKSGAEGESISFSTVVNDAKATDATKDSAAQHVITDEVTLQTRGTDAEAAAVEPPERVSAGVLLPQAATTLQGSSACEGAIELELHSSEAFVLDTTKEASGINQDEGPKRMGQHSSAFNEDEREIPSLPIPSTGTEGHDLLISVQDEAQATDTTLTESSQDLFASIKEVDKTDATKSSSNVKGYKDRQTEVIVSGSDKEQIMPNKLALDKQGSPAKRLNTVDVILTLPVSKPKETDNTEKNAVSVSPEVQVRPATSNSEKPVVAKNENILEMEVDASLEQEIDTSPEKEINCSDSIGPILIPEKIKVKVEDEAPLKVPNTQEVATLDNKLPILSMPEEKTDLSVCGGIMNSSRASPQNVDKAVDEACKDSVRGIVDMDKGKSLEEGPRKCSHWDFVLNEMSWLANDFMQERLWKIAASAQVARWIVKEKQQVEFEEMEVSNKQRKLAQGLAKAVRGFWQSVEARLLKEAAVSDSTLVDEALEVEAGMKLARSASSSPQVLPVYSYAMRILKDTVKRQWLPQAEAPLTPDRVSEFGMFDFWEEQFSEESLFYTVPQNAMEVYRQSILTQWEDEQRLQEHESTMTDLEPHLADAMGTLVSPMVTGKRSSGFLGGNQRNKGSIPTKRMRTSAVAARQRAAGGTGPLVSIPIAHFTRSDISSCDTNSQQDEMAGLLEGSSVSGRATDVDSLGAFARNNLAADGVDSPLKSKTKKKARHLGGHVGSAGCERDSEQLWQHNNHRQSEQSKQKGDQASLGFEGVGAMTGAYHGAASGTSANKLIKQIASRDRNRKHKVGKASLSQPGVGIPWSLVEDQAILGLVHELGLNWELVSDILSATSQLRGIFRKPKDCKERYRMLTDRGGDGGDSPDDPSSSAHHSIYKGGTRYLPQHMEETLKSHVDCILHLHQQQHSRKSQGDSQEPKQLLPEHESHGIKQASMTPLELCELSSASGELVPQSLHLVAPGVAMRSNLTAASAMQGVTNLQIPSMSLSAPSNATATRDAQRLGLPMRPTATEEGLRYSRMVAGRALQTQGLSVTSGPPLVSLPNTADGAAPSNVSSGNSAGMMCGLRRGMPVARMGLPGVGPMGVPNIAAGLSNTLPSVGMGVSGAGPLNAGAVSSPVNMMRRPREAISMGHSPSAALNNVNNSLPNAVAPSPAQNFGGVQQQQLQHNTSQSQQQSTSSNQQQAYNIMRVAKERQQLQHQQQQQQKQMLQQQQSSTSNLLQSPFQSSQSLPASQQHHGHSPHAHLFSQHQPSHLMMQPHALQEQQQQHAASVPQSAVSPSGQSSLSGSSQNSQQPSSLSQAQQPTSTASPSQSPFQSKHQNFAVKQQQQHQQHQSKNLKGLGREGQPNMAPSQITQAQCMGDSQGGVPQHLAAGSSAQHISTNSPHVSDAGAQQPFSQKGFSQHKHIPQQHLTSKSISSSVQPASPPTGAGVPQQQSSQGPAGSLPSTQQHRRTGQQSQGQQRRPQQSSVGMCLGPQLASQSAKIGLQTSSVLSQLPPGYQLGVNTNSPLTMGPLSSPSSTASGNFSSPQWKPGQTFTPMAAGLYNLSRSNSGIAAQAPHLAMSVGMHLPLPNGKTGNSLATQDNNRAGSLPGSGHVGTLPQKALVGPVVSSRPVGVSQLSTSPQQRHLAQQPQLTTSNTGGQQLRPGSSGTAPGQLE